MREVGFFYPQGAKHQGRRNFVEIVLLPLKHLLEEISPSTSIEQQKHYQTRKNSIKNVALSLHCMGTSPSIDNVTQHFTT